MGTLLVPENIRGKCDGAQTMICCNILGFSPSMTAVKTVIKKAALTNFPVLIQGETGTGKEMAAELLHCMSPRALFPMVKVNCGALTESLLSSELFGFAKGSFTDAKQDSPGKFKAANKGSLMLDEVSSSSPGLQATLLRVVERGEIEVVGQAKPVKVDVRLISLSNTPIEEEIAQKRFRADLAHRLSVLCINMPALRERKEDIPLLVQLFIEENNQLLGRKIKGIPEDVLEILLDYDWPGNVRELSNCIKRAFVLEEGEIITVQSLEMSSRFYADPKPNQHANIVPGLDLNIRTRCDDLVKGLIEEALRKTRGSKAKACKLLGINPKNLTYYLKKYGLPPNGPP